MFPPRKIFPPIGFCLLIPGLAWSAGKVCTTSNSRQFLVYGAEVRVRGTICALAERTKSDLLRLLGLRDGWKTPLIINLDNPQANIPGRPRRQLDFSQLGYGLKLQLNLLVIRETNNAALQRELLRAILVEIMYRDRGDVAAGTLYVAPPDWLVEGILALQPGRDSDKQGELFRIIVASKRISPLEDIVRQRRDLLDAPSRELYEAYARALVQLLLDTPDGRSKVVKYIADLPDAPRDAVADLRAHFPETLERSPDKWWALSVAQASATDRHEILSVPETVARLDRILRFSIPTANRVARGYTLGDYRTFLRLAASRAVLRQVSRQLLLLGGRAHPLYRAIVEESRQLADLLACGKAQGVPERLAWLARHRSVVEREVSAVDDYLNWFEATQSKTSSGAFSQVLEEAAANQTLPRRRDPISVYLDAATMETN